MPVTPFVEESEDSIHRQIDINVHGVISGTQLAIERMTPRGTGHIVNIASQAGKTAPPGIATYSATKHAVVGLCEAVRAELRGSGVEIHCVMPTVVNTELTSGVGQRWVKPVEAEDVADAIVEALEVGRFDVWVPKENGVIYRVMTLMPARRSRGDRPVHEGRQADDRGRPRRPQRLRGAGLAERAGAGGRRGQGRGPARSRLGPYSLACSRARPSLASGI